MHDEGLWLVVSSDGGTILEELNLQRCEEEDEQAVREECDIDSDSRNAGIHTWEMLMDMIKRGDEATETEDSFGDLMLKEWATSTLSFSIRGEESNMVDTLFSRSVDAVVATDDIDVSEYDPANSMSMEDMPPPNSLVGSMIRASSAERSPFLLADQGFHKSLILIVRDDVDCSEGVILNHMTMESIMLGDGKTCLPVRYGGPMQVSEPIMYLYSNESLDCVGVQMGNSEIYSCTEDEIIESIELGLASADDFLAIQGISVWKKNGGVGGVKGDVDEGFFEIVPSESKSKVWGTLISQRKLSRVNFEDNLALIQRAWVQAGGKRVDDGDGEDTLVFGTDVDVSTLADEALRRWVAVYLLDE